MSYIKADETVDESEIKVIRPRYWNSGLPNYCIPPTIIIDSKNLKKN